MTATTHEVLRPFTGMGQDLQRHDHVDTAGWPARRVQMLVLYGMLRPVDPPEAPPTPPPSAGGGASQGATSMTDPPKNPEPATRRGRVARKED